MISAGALSARARDWALAVFQRLGEAEAAVHQVPLETIHFHEVGALDSIADIVGGCVALDLLGVDAVCVAPLPVGCGTVECAHGTYPTPAPATSLLLEGMPIVVTDEPHELVDPHRGGPAPHLAKPGSPAPRGADGCAAGTDSATGSSWTPAERAAGDPAGVHRVRTAGGRLPGARVPGRRHFPGAGRRPMARFLEAGALDAFTTPSR